MNGVAKNITGLSIITTAQIPQFTKGQKALLQLIRDCVQNKTSLTFDDVVLVYYKNVRSSYFEKRWIREESSGQQAWAQVKYDVLDEYNSKSPLWTYVIRALVKSWLVSNIGILVLKNQLVIIPTIDIEDERNTHL